MSCLPPETDCGKHDFSLMAFHRHNDLGQRDAIERHSLDKKIIKTLE